MNLQLPTSDIFWSVIVAVFGGLAKYLDKYLKKQEKLNSIRLTASLIVSGFTGWIISELIVLMQQPSWRIMAAGIGGYAGVQLVEEVMGMVRARIIQSGNNDFKNNKQDSNE